MSDETKLESINIDDLTQTTVDCDRYKCPCCAKLYTSTKTLQKHLKPKLPKKVENKIGEKREGRFYCTRNGGSCNVSYTRQDGVNRHDRKKHPEFYINQIVAVPKEKTHHCICDNDDENVPDGEKCTKAYMSKDSLTRHIKQKHPNWK